MQDTNFHATWGPSESTCASGLAQLCTSGCTGKQVNDAAKTQCFSDINTQACSAAADGTLGNSCAAVCVDAPTGVGGNGGNGGGAGGSSGGTISDVGTFCRMLSNGICNRAYQCVPAAMRDADFTSNYGASLADCMAMTTVNCANPSADCPTYSAASGGTCVSMLTSATCTDLLFLNLVIPPQSCFTACGM